MRIAAEGYPFIGGLAGLALLLVLFPATRWAGACAFVLAGFVTFFFRDPERVAPGEPGLLVAPADGRVVYAGPRPDGQDGALVAIFLSLFDVHVNRSPAAGVVRRVRYRPGRFLPAYREEAGIENERNEFDLETDDGRRLTVRQIAGVVARRIVFWKRDGDRLGRGERFGLIRFGSRVELVVDGPVELRVGVGARVRGGETVVGALR